MDNGQTTLSKLLLSLLIGSILFSACRKESLSPATEQTINCKLQTENPAGRSYATESVVSFSCTDKHCGILPLSNKNYWVYQDSVYDNGIFLRIQYDTLRYSTNKKSLTDGIIWWESNFTVGLPETLFANESTFFTLGDRLFTKGIKDAKKDYSIPVSDTTRYLASFEDIAASGLSIRLKTAFKTPAGTFTDCVYFEKTTRSYRKDQVVFKPGLGVVKYIQEKAQPGNTLIKLQQISTLVAMHIE